MLGTQDRLTHGSASTHCVLCLNHVKGIFNIVFYTHTHTSIHLSIQHSISSQILTYIYHGIASHISYLRQQPNKHVSHRQKHHKTNSNIIFLSPRHGIHTCTYTFIKNEIKVISQTNSCWCECMTYLTYLIASQHLCINAWSFICMFMAKQRKNSIETLI